MIKDINLGAVHCDVVLDYSAEAVILMLKRFPADHGWPSRITSDPGTQLESAAGILTLWWTLEGVSAVLGWKTELFLGD